MLKKKTLMTLTLGALVSVSSFSYAEPFSTWQNEHEHKGKEYVMHHADQSPLPYDKLVEQYYNGHTPSDIQVQMKVALAFEQGLFGTPQNIHEAANWYNKAALNGSSEAAFKLYEYSKYTNNGKATEDGMDWLTIAAKKGDANSLYEMGNIYSSDMKASDKKLLTALGFYEKAYEQKHPLALGKIEDIERELRKRETSRNWKDFWAPFKSSEY